MGYNAATLGPRPAYPASILLHTLGLKPSKKGHPILGLKGRSPA